MTLCSFWSTWGADGYMRVLEEGKRRYFLLELDEEKTSTLNKVPLKTTKLQTLDKLWGNLMDMRPDKAQDLRSGSSSTSMCLSSSFSSVGYLSRRMKGLLRPVVSTRIPGLLAPFDSMNSPRSSLSSRVKREREEAAVRTQGQGLCNRQKCPTAMAVALHP